MKKLLLVLLSIFVFSGNLLAQEPERISAHQEHMIQFSSRENIASKFDISGKDIIPLKTSQAKALSKVVFGFLPDWEYEDGAHNNMHYDLLTHIACFDFEVSASGNITNPPGWPWTDVINTAHTNGTKVIMTVVNFNKTEIRSIITNPTSTNNLITNIKNIITQYNLDGVNIDFEGPYVEDRGDIMNNFMNKLTTEIHAMTGGKEVSFDGPAINWGGWKFENLAANVDHLFIMAYDYVSSTESQTNSHAPLILPNNGRSVTHSLNNYYADAIAAYPGRIVLGVPYYGRHWETSSSIAHASTTKFIKNIRFRDSKPEMDSKGKIWDNDSQTPWYKWQVGSQWNQVWADDDESIGIKYDLAISKNLGGVGMWALNYDGNRSELWNLISTKFAGGGLSVDDSFIKSNIALYPNPSTGTLKISNPNSIEINKVELFNIYGQKLKAGFYNNTIDFSRFNAGIYLIRIEDNEGKQGTFKIIKN